MWAQSTIPASSCSDVLPIDDDSYSEKIPAKHTKICRLMCLVCKNVRMQRYILVHTYQASMKILRANLTSPPARTGACNMHHTLAGLTHEWQKLMKVPCPIDRLNCLV
jgi:hypothetical protein